MGENSPEILKVEQVAQILHLHVMTVYRLAKEGKLPGFKVGGRWRFHRSVLEEWMADRVNFNQVEGEKRQRRRKAS